MKTQEKYTRFIKSIIPEKISVQLLTVKNYEDRPSRWTTKLGLCANKKVDIQILDNYSRSIKLKLLWDSKTAELLLFCPSHKSPEKILNELRNKISKTVNSSYTDEELIKIQEEYRTSFYKGFKGSKIKKI